MMDLDGFTFHEEPFSSAWADSAALREEHLQSVGGPRHSVTFNPNVLLFERLDELGVLVTITVRSNGRLFGYALGIVSPSLENAEHMQGTMTALFVSQDARGVGPRLINAVVGAMRARGVQEVILRAGVRGSGPKAGRLFKADGRGTDG